MVIMRNRRIRSVIAIEVIFILLQLINALIQICKQDDGIENAFFDVSIFVTKAVLVIAMGLALRKLR